jgi:hypothetical protein
MLRALLGFLIAPAVPALIVYVAEALRLTSSDAMKAAMAVGLFGYLSALVLGVPAFFFLRWASRTSSLAYLTTGALIGLVCYAVLFLPGAIQNWQGNPEGAALMIRNTAGFALLAVVAGSAAAVVFWAIAARRVV